MLITCPLRHIYFYIMCCTVLNHSVVSDSLWPHGCSPPGSSVHGVLQAKVLEWAAMPSSRGSSQPQDWTQVSHIAGRFFTIWGTREAQEYWSGSLSLLQGLFPTQESTWGLLHCKRILYQLSYQGSPFYVIITYQHYIFIGVSFHAFDFLQIILLATSTCIIF